MRVEYNSNKTLQRQQLRLELPKDSNNNNDHDHDQSQCEIATLIISNNISLTDIYFTVFLVSIMSSRESKSLVKEGHRGSTTKQ